jgi:diguanylate cyclase (GGDEF)-like protein
MRKATRNLEIKYEGQAISVTMSFGVTSSAPGERMTEKQFVQNADKALYQAKAKGKNSVCAFQPK